MVGSRPRCSGQLAGRAFVCVCAAFLPACGLVLGLDEGLSLRQGDASADANGAPSMGADSDGADSDATVESLDAPPGSTESGPGVSVRPIVGDGCTPDPSWCDSHCGTGPDNCGQTRQCPANCAQGYVCNTNNACACETESTWCTGRCGKTTDNCGKAIDCGTCDDASVCTAESYQSACGSRQCGQATNNCGQLVNCGVFGIGSACLNLKQTCLASGQCCSPSNASACGNQCGTFATNNCGQMVECPSSCGSGLVCHQNSCCTPSDPCSGACGVTRVDNCGQTIQCGCSGAAECLPSTSTCCTPQGCGANCIDSCGLPSSACCIDAGTTDAGDLDAEPTEATLPDGGAAAAGSE
jgi:hypothetical protein